MNRRRFLKGAGVAAAGVAASFVPFTIPDSRRATAAPALTPAPHMSHRYIFVSRYSGLRVQMTPHKALRFHGGVFRTDSDAEAAAIIRARRQEKDTHTYDIVQFGKERIPAVWFRGGGQWV